jgi:hypothetical protein
MHAGVSAASWTCGDYVDIAEAEATSKAVAKAVAEAVSLAYVNCFSSIDGGYVCAEAGTSISVWVGAVAKAWAGAWARAVTCVDTCKVSVDVVVEAVGHILVDAATDAYVGLCASVPPLLVMLAMTALYYSSWMVIFLM